MQRRYGELCGAWTTNTPDRVAERLRSFGPLGVLAFLVILAGNLLFVPLSGLLVLA